LGALTPADEKVTPSQRSNEETAMPTFDTPDPISVRLSLGFVVANVRVTAGDRTDTTVEVRPMDAFSKPDLKIAEQTRIEYADGRLVVRAPRLAPLFSRSGGSIDVTVELPSGSRLQGETGMGDFLSEGRLGECQFKTGYGQIRLDRADTVNLNSGSGDVTVDHADGRAEITTGNGALNIGRIDGPATVKNSNGATWIGEVTGDLRLNASNGGVTVDRAHAGVTAKTANGSVRIGEVTRGAVTLETAAGSIEAGISAGTAAWLDLKTLAGRVRNELAAAAGPDNTEETVEVRARTHVGDIIVRRT
jgi:Putative adhesin